MYTTVFPFLCSFLMRSRTSVPESGSSMKLPHQKQGIQASLQESRLGPQIVPVLHSGFLGSDICISQILFRQEPYPHTYEFLQEEGRDFLGQKPDLLLRFCPQTEFQDSGTRYPQASEFLEALKCHGYPYLLLLPYLSGVSEAH